jgi:hypothetical protein
MGRRRVSWRASARGSAGFNLLPNSTGSLELMLAPRADASTPVHVAVRVDGYAIDQRTLSSDPARIRLTPRHPGFHFVEVTATDAAGNAAPVEIEVWR